MDSTLMPFTIHKEPDKDRRIVMGKADEPVADYYPPGATEPIVRPADVPAPEPDAEPAPGEEAEIETVIGNKETTTKRVVKKK
jgi:hypothetical protein